MVTDCYIARARLSPPEQPRVASPEIVEARRHVEECAACQEYFAQDQALIAAYARMRNHEAPRDLRERVFDALARERATRSARQGHVSAEARQPRPSARTRATQLAAAAIVLLVGFGAGALSLTRKAGADPTGEAAAFVQDYLRRAVGEDHIATSDPTEISRFLARELGIAISPLELADLELAGAEVCLLEGRRGALILYKKDGRVVSHYLIPRDRSRPRPPAPAPGASLAQAGEAPPAVVMWATTGFEHALVGPLPSDQLLSLARAAVTND